MGICKAFAAVEIVLLRKSGYVPILKALSLQMICHFQEVKKILCM
jgi:hypothetical protein